MNNRWRRVFKLAGKTITAVPGFYVFNQYGGCITRMTLSVEGVSEKLGNEIIKNIKRKKQKLQERYERRKRAKNDEVFKGPTPSFRKGNKR